MATAAEDLEAIYLGLIAEYKTEVAYITANGKPKLSYSIGGQSVDWMGWKRGQMAAIKEARQEMLAAQGAWSITSLAR